MLKVIPSVTYEPLLQLNPERQNGQIMWLLELKPH